MGVSTYFFMVDVGTGLGPVLLGWLVAATSYRTMYAVSAILVALAAVLYHLVHGRRPRGAGEFTGEALDGERWPGQDGRRKP